MLNYLVNTCMHTLVWLNTYKVWLNTYKVWLNTYKVWLNEVTIQLIILRIIN